MNSLNTKQQHLVEDNHNLIYSFAHLKKLDLEEYYDLLAIALCKAALIFDENKGMFSTLVYMCMNNEVKLIKRKEKEKKTIPKYMVDSLDYIYSSDNDDSENSLIDKIIKDIFPAPDESVVNAIMFNNFYYQNLDNRERLIVDLVFQGKNQTDISKKLLVSQPQVSRLIKGVANKWIKYNK